MGFYILKRLLITIPFSVMIVLFSLLLNQTFFQPIIDLELSPEYATQDYIKATQNAECQKRKVLHLDLPVFYFSIQPAVIPDNLLKICQVEERNFVRMLCLSNGNTTAALAIYNRIKQLSNLGGSIDYGLLFHSKSMDDFMKDLLQINSDSELKGLVSQHIAQSNYISVFLPSFSFHGTENQFNYWLKNAVKFNFGDSVIHNLPVTHLVNSALLRTLSFTIPAIVFIFILSILLGIFTSIKNNKASNFLLNFLYFIDAIPLFWVSILLISITGTYYFTASQYGFTSESMTIFQSIQTNIFPILALLIVSLPYVTKQVHSSINHIKNQAYIQTAIAKGLSNSQVICKHIFPNAALPIIVLGFNFLASAFGGAFVVELIFSISGIGKLMADSIMTNDYQVVTLILLYLVFIKMLLMIVSDITLYILNPELKFQ